MKKINLSVLYWFMLFAIFVFPYHCFSQDGSGTINWNGVSGPYHFEGFYSPKDGISWSVGGQGYVRFQSIENGLPEEREYHLPNEDFDDSFYGAWFNIEGKGWIVGSEGIILHTEDNGYFWRQQNSNTKETLKDITCVDEKKCWILGENTALLLTKDGGKNWKKLNNVSGEAIEFVNAKIGWVVAHDSVFLTKNGGRSWTEVRISTQQKDGGYFKTVKFSNEKIGYIGGYERLASTNDGGKTWKVTEFPLKNFVGLVVHNSNSVLAVSTGEYNYCSDDLGKTWRKCFRRKNNK